MEWVALTLGGPPKLDFHRRYTLASVEQLGNGAWVGLVGEGVAREHLRSRHKCSHTGSCVL
jgi:hypothetical protein